MAEYNPTPVDTTNVDLPRNLNLLVEKIAENTHDIWAQQRLSEGWTYGLERDDKNKKHPDLVPYSALSYEEQDYDRRTSMESLKLIHKLGFSVLQKTEGAVMLVGSYTASELADIANAAINRGLRVVSFSNWADAKLALEKSMAAWHAIIFDVYARLKRDEEESWYFLRDCVDDMGRIFNLNRNEVPWYVLTRTYANPADNDEVDTVVGYVVGHSRIEKQDNWGAVQHELSGIDALFKQIADLLPTVRNYRLRNVYEKVFEVMDRHFSDDSVDRMLRVLQPLHSPEVFFSFDPSKNYNDIRHVAEEVLDVCIRHQIIPCGVGYDDFGNVAIANSVDYLQDTAKSDVPAVIGDLMNTITEYTNKGSHYGEKDNLKGFYYSVESLALHLCDVIIWLGDYIREKGLKGYDELISEYEGTECKLDLEMKPTKTGKTLYFYHNDQCVIRNFWDAEQPYKDGDSVELFNVKCNTDRSRNQFPLSAECRKA